jgi:CRP-like cAMP-binding protein
MRLSKRGRVDLLRSIWLFERCSRRELETLERATTPVDVPAGKVLTREGDPGREFFVIVDGHAEVTRRGQVIGELGAGSFCGEMSLLDRQPRSATVTTTEPTELLVLGAHEFDTVVASMPSVDRKMLTMLAGRLRDIETRYVPADARLIQLELA